MPCGPRRPADRVRDIDLGETEGSESKRSLVPGLVFSEKGTSEKSTRHKLDVNSRGSVSGVQVRHSVRRLE